MNDGLDIFQEWRTADRVARAAEQLVMREAMASLAGEDTTGPTPEDRQAAHRLRAAANDLFALSMSELKRRSEQLRR